MKKEKKRNETRIENWKTDQLYAAYKTTEGSGEDGPRWPNKSSDTNGGRSRTLRLIER
jgi:hypothetical protein